MKQYTFPKPEHLCLKRDIDALFCAGSHSMAAWPLRIIYRPVEHTGSGPKVKVLLSVSKRRLRHAVDRNRAKRQLREAYRHEKPELLSSLLPEEGLHIGFLWLSERPVETELVRKRMKTLLNHVAEKTAAARIPSAPKAEA